jgi:hypothetical protein
VFFICDKKNFLSSVKVADRDIIRTHQEAERNAAIKNAMRGSCVEKLVESWYHILVSIILYLLV